MALAFYLIFVVAACGYALVDWRRAWLLIIVCSVIQDPVRKLTAGAPVYISFLVVGFYAVILFAARNDIGSTRPSSRAASTAFPPASSYSSFC